LLIAHSLKALAAARCVPSVCDSSPPDSLLLSASEDPSLLLLSVLLPVVNTWDQELPISQLTACSTAREQGAETGSALTEVEYNGKESYCWPA
jgi:hypothetical protein